MSYEAKNCRISPNVFSSIKVFMVWFRKAAGWPGTKKYGRVGEQTVWWVLGTPRSRLLSVPVAEVVCRLRLSLALSCIQRVATGDLPVCWQLALFPESTKRPRQAEFPPVTVLWPPRSDIGNVPVKVSRRFVSTNDKADGCVNAIHRSVSLVVLLVLMLLGRHCTLAYRLAGRNRQLG